MWPCRYLDARASKLKVPLGLGTRHMAAAAISKISSAIGIVVSETATVRIPEWIAHRRNSPRTVAPEPLYKLSGRPHPHRAHIQPGGADSGNVDRFRLKLCQNLAGCCRGSCQPCCKSLVLAEFPCNVS